jgi:hypothetical protein
MVAQAKAGAKADMRTLRTGDRIVVRYDGEPGFHERLLLWPLGGSSWVICTPDFDTYEEDHDDTNYIVMCSKVQRGGRLPRGVSGPVYRFDAALSKAELAKLLRESLPLAEEACALRGTEVIKPVSVVMWDGTEEAANELLEIPAVAEVVRRRLSIDWSHKKAGVQPKQVAFAAGGGGLSPSAGPPGAVAAAGSGGDVTPGCWLTSEPTVHAGGTLEIGTEVDIRDTDVVKGNRGIVERHLGGASYTFIIPVEFVLEEDINDYVAHRIGIFAPASDGVEHFKKVLAKPPLPSPPVDEEAAEARVLEVHYDDHGERYREFKDATKDMVEDAFSDWPVEGPRSVLWLCKNFARQGLTPTTWLEKHIHEQRYADTDRSLHELRMLAEVFYQAVTYDQLNVASLASFELMGRRWQLILDAHSTDAQKPNYEGSIYYSGLEHQRFGIMPDLSAHVARRMKEDVQIEVQRGKARELKAAPAAAAFKAKAKAKAAGGPAAGTQ